jgi:hypothetical protein
MKYEKEQEYIIRHYMNEEKKRNFFKQKAVNAISRNMNLMKKIQEVFNYNIDRSQEYGNRN